MAYTIVDRIMDVGDELRRGVRSWLRADPTEYYPIVGPHSSNVLALHNGSLLSVIKIHGYMGQYFPDQFESVVDTWSKFFRITSNDNTSKGFDLFWSYEFNPEGMVEKARAYRSGMIAAAKRRGLDVEDILVEEADLYGEKCAMEPQYLIVVTHLDSLLKAEHSAALAQRNKDMKSAMKGAAALKVQYGLKAIEALHEQHVNKVSVHLETAAMGYSFERLTCYEFLKASRESFLPGTTGPGWNPKLSLRDCRFRPTDEVPQATKSILATDKPVDWSFMMPPAVSRQMVPEGVIDLGKFAVVGDRVYAPMFVSELAVEPAPLEDLIKMCYKRRLPLRLVYSIMANPDDANYWNRMFASIFNFASASNRQIAKADRAMKAYQESNGAVFGYGVSLSTWAEAKSVYTKNGEVLYDLKEVQKRAQDIETLAQQWGGQQIDSMFGCSIEASMDAAPGYSIPPACPKAPQIETDIITQLPLMRPARLWPPEKAIWFRTADGVLSPYQPYSSSQSTMLSLVLGGMGYGKSNLISEHIWNFTVNPDNTELPYIRGIDFGASASGVVKIIRDALAHDKKHQAMFRTFTNDGNMVKNMFDTRLGFTGPLEDQRKSLVNWLITLCDDLVQKGHGGSVEAVLNAGVLRVYERSDPKSHFFDARPYVHEQAEPLIRDKVSNLGIDFDERTHYWEITQALLEYGLRNKDDHALHVAKVAQRYAVPRFADLVGVVDSLAQDFADAPMVDGKSITASISNALLNANSIYKCFSGVTNTDISESRICILDMSEAFGRGDTRADVMRRIVLFGVVYRLLTEDLFVNKNDSGDEIVRQQESLLVDPGNQWLAESLIKWHVEYFFRQDNLTKVFLADELHRLGGIKGATSTIDSMAYEGRKYKVGLLLGTQMPQHFPEDMLKLATSIFMFGASQSSTNANVMQDLFDLTDDEKKSVMAITKPNAEKGAEVFVIHKTESGVQRLKLHFQVGARKRWAYATAPNERALRDILYARGPSEAWARSALAENVRSVDAAITRKQELHAGDMSQQEALNEIAEELLQLVR